MKNLKEVKNNIKWRIEGKYLYKDTRYVELRNLGREEGLNNEINERFSRLKNEKLRKFEFWKKEKGFSYTFWSLSRDWKLRENVYIFKEKRLIYSLIRSFWRENCAFRICNTFFFSFFKSRFVKYTYRKNNNNGIIRGHLTYFNG